VSPARKSAGRRRRGGSAGGGASGFGRMALWLLVPAGLALAGWVVFAVATAGPSAQADGETGQDAGEIGDASREALRDILREADAEERADAGRTGAEGR